MMAERWSAFQAYASRALGKPAYDAEEREPRLRVAAALREALASEKPSTASEKLRECITAVDYPSADLTIRKQNEWLEQWLAADDAHLATAVKAFRSADLALERFAAFAGAAEAASAAGTIPTSPNAVLAFGSLFNFALEAARLPFVLARPFRGLEELLGHDLPRGDSVTDAYEHHLAFARSVEERLREAGVPVRDMLDVQSVIVDASRNSPFWQESPDASVAPGERPEPAAYLSVCAIYRDEAAYLREWIEFHRVVGVERFFLYNNGSADDHLKVLGPYVDAGIVRLHDWPMAQGQLPAYEHCIAEHGIESRWIAFIDLDEFLFSPTGRPLPDVLGDYEQWPAVGVNWAVFGPSGHVQKPPGLVIESYLERLNVAANKTIKSIVDPTRVARCASVHKFVYDRLGTVDENHYPIFGGQAKSVSFERLRINHYFTKSHEEHGLRSSRNVGVYLDSWRARNMVEREFDPGVLNRWELGAESDEAITQYLPALREALERSPSNI